MQTRKWALLVSTALAAISGTVIIFLAANETLFGEHTKAVLGTLAVTFIVSLFAAAGIFSLRNHASRNVDATSRQRGAPPHRADVAAKLDAIAAEMQRIRMWQAEPIEAEKMRFNQAFAMDTMAFTQWLPFVFIPHARAQNNGNGEWPASSMVAAQSAPEFDGMDDAQQLHQLLIEFDVLIDPKVYT